MKKIKDILERFITYSGDKAFDAYAAFIEPLAWLVAGIQLLCKTCWPFLAVVIFVLFLSTWPIWVFFVYFDKFMTWARPKIGYFFTFCWCCGHDNKVYDFHPNVLTAEERWKFPLGYRLIHCQYCNQNLEVPR